MMSAFFLISGNVSRVQAGATTTETACSPGRELALVPVSQPGLRLRDKRY